VGGWWVAGWVRASEGTLSREKQLDTSHGTIVSNS
jgi:hypothetical protein